MYLIYTLRKGEGMIWRCLLMELIVCLIWIQFFQSSSLFWRFLCLRCKIEDSQLCTFQIRTEMISQVYGVEPTIIINSYLLCTLQKQRQWNDLFCGLNYLLLPYLIFLRCKVTEPHFIHGDKWHKHYTEKNRNLMDLD